MAAFGAKASSKNKAVFLARFSDARSGAWFRRARRDAFPGQEKFAIFEK